MVPRKAAFLVGAMCLFPAAAPAETFVQSLRCNTKIVSVGDDTVSLRLKCGEPMIRETNQTVCFYERRVSRCMTVDAWTYNPGAGQFLHTMMIEGGRIVAIRQGDRVE